MLLLLLSLVVTALYFVLRHYRAKMRPLVEKAEKIPGPQTLPLVGNALEFGTSTKRNKAFFSMSLENNSFSLLQSGGTNSSLP
jgi:hypothetical protein